LEQVFKGVGSRFLFFPFHWAFSRATATSFETLLQLPVARPSRRTSIAVLKFQQPSPNRFSLDEDSRLEDRSPLPALVHPEPAPVVPSSLIHRVDIASDHIGCQASSFRPATLNAWWIFHTLPRRVQAKNGNTSVQGAAVAPQINPDEHHPKPSTEAGPR
jgi:hypothetical protein